MVQKIFNIERDTDSANGWCLFDGETDTKLNMPQCIYEAFTGKYISADELLNKVSTVQIALAGVTNSLRVVDPVSLDRRSVLKTFALNGCSCGIDDEIDEYLTSPAEYEKHHIIYMDRDTDGNDKSIHAYIETPKNGKLRCQFKDDNDVRLNAKRNNIKYWIDDYKIVAGSNGGLYVMTLNSTITELL